MSTDDQLLEQVSTLRCQMGDKTALAELIEQYEGPLRYFISRLLGDAKMSQRFTDVQSYS
ncbi:MAG TPA: hypothetical protein ENI81_05630 [Phycisphaerales bacterium]|nr:hypothetical protein [Phycisphaerales bacterium]